MLSMLIPECVMCRKCVANVYHVMSVECFGISMSGGCLNF